MAFSVTWDRLSNFQLKYYLTSNRVKAQQNGGNLLYRLKITKCPLGDILL